MAGRRKDPMAKLRQSHDADGHLVWELTERASLLAGDEDRRIEKRLDARPDPYSWSVVSGNA